MSFLIWDSLVNLIFKTCFKYLKEKSQVNENTMLNSLYVMWINSLDSKLKLSSMFPRLNFMGLPLPIHPYFAKVTYHSRELVTLLLMKAVELRRPTNCDPAPIQLFYQEKIGVSQPAYICTDTLGQPFSTRALWVPPWVARASLNSGWLMVK